jgi:GNAT superfamily N-acetyltransferase
VRFSDRLVGGDCGGSREMFSDHSLSCRLERAEAAANAGFVEPRARLVPSSRAEWIGVAGAYAMYDGPRSPCTQTFGLGLFAIPTAADMDNVEAFFKERGAPVFHEVSPIAAKSHMPILSARRYQPIEFTSVMYLVLNGQVSAEAAGTGGLQVRTVGEPEHELWAQTVAEGWREFTEIADLMLDLGRVTAAREDGACFLVDSQGHPIAAGALAIHERVALLAGASTLPEWRRRGAQRALLESRLRYAAQAGCDLAMMCAEPGSASQRNAERQGFRIAYTRIKFGLVE